MYILPTGSNFSTFFWGTFMLLCIGFYTGLHRYIGLIQKMAYKLCILLLSFCCIIESELIVCFPHVQSFTWRSGEIYFHPERALRLHTNSSVLQLNRTEVFLHVLCASGNLSLTQLCCWTAPAITLSLMQEPNSSMSFKIFNFVLTVCFRLIFKQFNSTCYIELQSRELNFWLLL